MNCKKDCKKLNIKNFIMGRWFPLILALLIIGLILTVGFLFGFRITYAPELKNDWEAISGVAAWGGIIVSIASAVASFMAVWYAIRVADKQNKVTLFEKRYDVYSMLKRCTSFSESIKDNQDNINVRYLFIVSFSFHPVIEDKSEKAIHIECTKYAMQLKSALDRASFLFDYDTAYYCRPVVYELFRLLYSTNCDKKEQIKKYQVCVQTMEKNLLPRIESDLSLKK